jgi:hypothetical protein
VKEPFAKLTTICEHNIVTRRSILVVNVKTSGAKTNYLEANRQSRGNSYSDTDSEMSAESVQSCSCEMCEAEDSSRTQRKGNVRR